MNRVNHRGAEDAFRWLWLLQSRTEESWPANGHRGLSPPPEGALAYAMSMYICTSMSELVLVRNYPRLCYIQELSANWGSMSDSWSYTLLEALH